MTAEMDADRQIAPLLENVLKDRACGACTECCTSLRVPALDKPAGVPCRHLTAGGCGIYATRPGVCRGWHCLWRISDQLPEEARPDRIGVVFALHWAREKPAPPFTRAYVAAVARSSVQDFDHPTVKAALVKLAELEVMPVWVSVGDRSAMIFPEDDLADAILHSATTPHRHLLDKAAVLRRKWSMEAPAQPLGTHSST